MKTPEYVHAFWHASEGKSPNVSEDETRNNKMRGVGLAAVKEREREG